MSEAGVSLQPGDLRFAVMALALVLLLAAALAAYVIGVHMKRIVTFPLVAAFGLMLAGCSGLGLTGQGAGNASLLQAIVTDPNCAHHDEATAVVGAAGVPASVQVRVVRDCPARPTAPAPAPAVTP